ncbi:hypothetical protein PG291_01555 [Riemerella anatipestifer]|nr:hypothetical protein [Riemerella anatipestifer]
MLIKAGREHKKQEKVKKEAENLFLKYSDKIAEIQDCEFISVSEAAIMYGISKYTIYRMIK